MWPDARLDERVLDLAAPIGRKMEGGLSEAVCGSASSARVSDRAEGGHVAIARVQRGVARICRDVARVERLVVCVRRGVVVAHFDRGLKIL